MSLQAANCYLVAWKSGSVLGLVESWARQPEMGGSVSLCLGIGMVIYHGVAGKHFAFLLVVV